MFLLSSFRWDGQDWVRFWLSLAVTREFWVRTHICWIEKLVSSVLWTLSSIVICLLLDFTWGEFLTRLQSLDSGST